MGISTDEHRLRIAVLFGGSSAEREISLRSGAAVASALESAGHQVSIIDPTDFPLANLDRSTIDACFIALHGGAGEDGRIQQELEQLGIAYTGSGPQACRLAMSKLASKRQFVSCGVPTPPFVQISSSMPLAEVAAQLQPLGYPLVIKPDQQGSSLGVSIADSPQELSTCIAEALQYDDLAIAEPLVRGREFTVAMVDERSLPLVEIVSAERVFSFDAKYQSALTEYRLDCELPAGSRAELSRVAAAAAQALGTAGLVRTDLILDHDGRVWVLEVNTSPGMTARSLAPQAASRAGLDLSALCDLLVRQSLTTVGAA